MGKQVVIIGAGVGGLATACIFGQAGYDVTVLEKNAQPGGRAGSFEAEGFRFDTGPSWYLMPDVFEQFFELLGEDVNELLDLKRLEPSYRVFFKDTLFGAVDIVGDIDRDGDTLEALEPGARTKLRDYLEKSAVQYNIAIDQFLYKNHNSLSDFFTPRMLGQALRMNVLTSMEKYVSRYFSSPEVQKIMQYPLVFLGVGPTNAPALYNILNHVDFTQGVYYPQGGMYKLVEALVNLAEVRGVKLICNAPVKSIEVKNRKTSGVKLENDDTIEADIVISNADIAYTEQNLLNAENRSYSDKYWKKRVMAPSTLLMYLGVSKKYPNLRHHNLVFSRDWVANFKDIFDNNSWPRDPSFYVCNPNKTDPTSAPKGHENLFVMVPLPARLDYSNEELGKYADWVLNTIEQNMHLDGLKDKIVYKKLFCARDFKEQFNSYQGSALGLAHTLKQTASFRPSNNSRKVEGLYYVGANTNPGIGLPMCLISAQLVYKRLNGLNDSKPLSYL